jgi:hypothetical protein
MLLLRLLHRILGGRSRSNTKKGTFIMCTFPPWLFFDSRASMQSALRHQPRPLCEEYSGRQRVPEVGQAPESSSWENRARFPEALKPIRCARLPWCWWCSDVSSPCCLGYTSSTHPHAEHPSKLSSSHHPSSITVVAACRRRHLYSEALPSN